MRKLIVMLTAAAVISTPSSSFAQLGQGYGGQGQAVESQQQHAALIQEYGGAETGARAAYVDAVGRRVAARSGVAGSAVHFTTLNSPVENAFSVPGGYVYITRQLMELMNDESELAFALGHETGHIAANHAQSRQAYARRNNILSVLGAVMGGMIGNSVFGNMISQRAQLAAKLRTLSFSREQEYQADTLGLRYMMQAGYDPAGAAGILSALGRATALEARVQGRTNRQAPEWASTHPLSENRVQRVLQQAQASGRLGTGVRNRDQFLSQLEGIYVDDDPAQGVIEGRTFTHPDLRIQFAVPVGYLMSNGTTAVTIKGTAGQAQFGGGRYNGTLANYILAVFQDLTEGQLQLTIPPPQRTTINGMPAAYTTSRVNTGSGAVDASVVAYQWDSTHIYHFVMITQGGAGIGPFAGLVNSLRRITPAEAAAIRPRVIHVVAVAPGDTIQSLANRMAYRDFKTERFLSLNGLSAASALAPGQRVKLVVFGTRTAHPA